MAKAELLVSTARLSAEEGPPHWGKAGVAEVDDNESPVSRAAESHRSNGDVVSGGNDHTKVLST